jgi:hypothetical protein
MSDDLVLDYIEGVKAEKDALRFERDEALKRTAAAERTLAALREELDRGPRDLYEIRRAVRVAYQDEGMRAATATGFTRAVVSRPQYLVALEVVPFDSGELNGRLGNDETVFELGFPGSRSIYACLTPPEGEAFRLWWNAAPGKTAKGAK